MCATVSMADTTNFPNPSVDDLQKHAMKVFKDATKGYQHVYYKFLTVQNYDDLNEYAISVYDALAIDDLYTEQAKELFKPRLGLPVLPDVAILTMVMISYAATGNTNAVLMVYKQMLATGVTPTSFTFTVLILALTTDSSSNDYVEYAKKYFLEMLDMGIKPHSSSYISVFKAIAGRQSVDNGSEFLKQIKAKGFIPESNAPRFEEDYLTESLHALTWYNDLIKNTSDKEMKRVFRKWNDKSYLKKQSKKMFDALVKDGYNEECKRLYTSNYTTGILPMVTLETSVIEAYLKRGKTKGALEVYRRMLATGVAPNSYTYTVLIKGLSADPNFVRDAKRCLLEMMGRGIWPKAATYTAVIQSFVKKEDMASEEEGKELVEEMMSKGFVPNAKAMLEVLKGSPTPEIRRIMNIVLSKLKG